MTIPLKLSSDHRNDATLVSNLFLDHYMPSANGEFIKIYLYLLRWLPSPDHDLSLGGMADCFDLTESDVLRALRYWEKAGLLTLSRDGSGNLTEIILRKPKDPSSGSSQEAIAEEAEEKEAQAEAETVRETAVKAVVRQTPPADTGVTRRNYTMQELSGFQQDDDGELIMIIQQYLGHLLSPNDLNTIMFFYDGLGFSRELIEYLFEYCISSGHTDMRYIEKVAIAWHGRHVTSVDDAKTQCSTHQRACYEVLRAFGLNNRSATLDEARTIMRWIKTYGFSMEMVLEACRRTMNTIHRPEFNYTESILMAWKEAGAVTLEDVAALDQARSKKREETEASKNQGQSQRSRKSFNKFHNFQQRTYDYSELEKKLARKVQSTASSGPNKP